MPRGCWGFTTCARPSPAHPQPRSAAVHLPLRSSTPKAAGSKTLFGRQAADAGGGRPITDSRSGSAGPAGATYSSSSRTWVYAPGLPQHREAGRVALSPLECASMLTCINPKALVLRGDLHGPTLQRALADTLAIYPILAGRLHRAPGMHALQARNACAYHIVLNNAGALFVEDTIHTGPAPPPCTATAVRSGATTPTHTAAPAGCAPAPAPAAAAPTPPGHGSGDYLEWLASAASLGRSGFSHLVAGGKGAALPAHMEPMDASRALLGKEPLLKVRLTHIVSRPPAGRTAPPPPSPIGSGADAASPDSARRLHGGASFGMGSSCADNHGGGEATAAGAGSSGGGGGGCVLALTLHHAVLDGHSAAMVINCLAANYKRLAAQGGGGRSGGGGDSGGAGAWDDPGLGLAGGGTGGGGGRPPPLCVAAAVKPGQGGPRTGEQEGDGAAPATASPPAVVVSEAASPQACTATHPRLLLAASETLAAAPDASAGAAPSPAAAPHGGAFAANAAAPGAAAPLELLRQERPQHAAGPAPPKQHQTQQPYWSAPSFDRTALIVPGVRPAAPSGTVRSGSSSLSTPSASLALATASSIATWEKAHGNGVFRTDTSAGGAAPSAGSAAREAVRSVLRLQVPPPPSWRRALGSLAALARLAAAEQRAWPGAWLPGRTPAARLTCCVLHLPADCVVALKKSACAGGRADLSTNDAVSALVWVLMCQLRGRHLPGQPRPTQPAGSCARRTGADPTGATGGSAGSGGSGSSGVGDASNGGAGAAGVEPCLALAVDLRRNLLSHRLPYSYCGMASWCLHVAHNTSPVGGGGGDGTRPAAPPAQPDARAVQDQAAQQQQRNAFQLPSAGGGGGGGVMGGLGPTSPDAALLCALQHGAARIRDTLGALRGQEGAGEQLLELVAEQLAAPASSQAALLARLCVSQDAMVTSWGQFPYWEADFGPQVGSPVRYQCVVHPSPPWMAALLSARPDEGGGLHLLVNVPAAAVNALRASPVLRVLAPGHAFVG